MVKPEKAKINIWARILLAVVVIIFSVSLAIWITGYTYIYKTLIYTFPDIDDLDIFNTRLVNDSFPIQWLQSSNYNKIKLPSEVDLENQKNESVAFLVIKNDSIAYEQYWDNYSAQSYSNSFSVAKSIVGILTGIAIGGGLISIDDSVGKYIPEFKDGDNGKLKVRHLLTMSSGLNWDESYSSLFSPTTEAYYGRNLTRLVTRLKVIEEPGKVYRYMSCNTVLLSMIISKASGMSISEFAAQKLWKPINATQSAYWSLDQSNGIEKSYCCFYSNARDFAKVGKLYMDSGKWNNRQIVSAEYIKLSTTPNGCVDERGNTIDYYGYQWWIANIDSHPVFYARGILGQYIIVIPDERIIIVRLGKKRGEKNDKNQYTDMLTYTGGVLKVFGNSR